MPASITANRAGILSRTAMAGALALGAMIGGAVLAPTPVLAAKAPKMSLSKGFVAAAQPAQAAVNAAVAGDEASLSAAKTAIDAAVAAATNDDDRFMAGSLLLNLGGKAKKPDYQRQGLKLMLDSGKADAAMAPKLYSAAGQLAYQAKDYALAQTYLQQAIALNATDADSKVMLGETLIANNQVPKGMEMLKSAIRDSKAGGTVPPESWYRRGLSSAYKAGAINDAADFGTMLITDYPQSANVGIAATIVREMGKYGAQDTLDIMRLMGRSKSFAESRDYIEYIEAADPRRLPGETLDVIAAGVAAGKLRANDSFVADMKSLAGGRLSADKASLVGYEADARKGSATETTISGAADALLSYGKASQAADLYQLALAKPGVDANRALTRLGIAQFDQGKYADAMATFAKVTGPRQPIAKLWSAYAASKMKGVTAPAAAQ